MVDLARLFEYYREEEDFRARCMVAFRNPVLLTIAAVRSLLQQLQSGKSPAENAEERLAELDGLRGFLIKAPLKYPIGEGPVEPIVARVIKGELSLDGAIDRVRDPAFRHHLSQTYLVCLMTHAAQQVGSAKPDSPWYLGRVIVEGCLAANPDGKVEQRLFHVAYAFNQVVVALLNHIPRGDVFRWSLDFFEGLIQRTESYDQSEDAGAFLHAAGTLCSDPFVAARTLRHYDRQVIEWDGRLTATYGNARAAHFREKFPLPSAKDALTTAVAYFRRAVPRRVGEHRGVSLKAIVNCSFWLHAARWGAVDLEDMRQLAREAFALLPAGSYHETALRRLIKEMGLSLEIDAAAAPSEHRETRYPDEVVQRAHALEERDPRAAFGLLTEAAPLYGPDVPSALRASRWNLMANLMSRAADVTLPAFSDVDSFRSAFEDLMRVSESEGWPADRVAAAVFGMAIGTTTIDAEHIGLTLLATTEKLFPQSVTAHAELIHFARAQLEVGVAVNALKDKRPIDAITHYAAAVAENLFIHMNGPVRELVERIADLAGQVSSTLPAAHTEGEEKDDPLFTALLAVIDISRAVEQRLGPTGSEVLQAAYRRFFRGLSTANSVSLSALMQFAKGAQFSSWLRHPPRLRWSDDPTLARLAPEIARLESSNVAPGAAAPTASIEDELELVSHAGAPDAVGDDQADAPLVNLRRAFNQRLEEMTTSWERKDVFIDPRDIADRLSDRSVLLDLFVADHDDTHQVLVSMVYTRDEFRLFANVIEESRTIAEVVVRGRQVYLTGLSLVVAKLRQQLQRFSGPRPVDGEAEEALRAHPRGLLGPSLLEHLAALKAKGKDHLCICPNQGLRYYPLHLLAPGGRYLADDWIVTYLPSLQCLMRKPSAGSQTRTISVLALTFRDQRPFALPHLQSAEGEARDIAKAFGIIPLIDEQVTEKVILTALATSRYVHLCTHGQHDRSAPVFQTVFATPTDGQDGRLRAYELLGEDLRGLEVVTLAACDSALGRFDISDNLTGLPATLLIAGAQTIVASMWSAHDEASRTFFVEFYAALQREEPRLDAFRKAQNKVRAAFPGVRHWAAFCLMGSW